MCHSAEGAPPRRRRFLALLRPRRDFYGLAYPSCRALSSAPNHRLWRCFADCLRDSRCCLLPQGRQVPLSGFHFRVCARQSDPHHPRTGGALYPLRHEDAAPPACLHAVWRRSPAAAHRNHGASATADATTSVTSSTPSLVPRTKHLCYISAEWLQSAGLSAVKLEQHGLITG
jgi:hypothetical protein